MADICLTCGNETNWMCVWCVYIEMTIEENWKQPLKLAIHWISEMDVRNIAYGTFAFEVFDVIVRVLFHLTANGIQYIIHIRECPWWFANAIVNSFELHWMTSNTDLYDDMAFPCKQIIQVHFFFNRFNGFLCYLFLVFHFTWIRGVHKSSSLILISVSKMTHVDIEKTWFHHLELSQLKRDD